MKHTLTLNKVKKTYINKDNKEVTYNDLYLVLDGYLIVKLEKNDNLKNLKYLLNNITENDIELNYKCSK